MRAYDFLEVHEKMNVLVFIFTSSFLWKIFRSLAVSWNFYLVGFEATCL